MGKPLRAVPAQFDQSTQHRRSMLAKINIARHQLNMDEDDYRQMLLDVTGKASLKVCSDPQLARVLDRLKQLGFQPIQRKGNPPAAQHPMARKARALWISLYHLGVVRSADERALEAFAKRQLGCEKLVWARQSDAFKLIEALKNMAVRNGWVLVDHRGQPLLPIGVRESLCKAIVSRLQAKGAIPADWTIDDAAYRLCGITLIGPKPVTAEQYQRLAEVLGRKLREMTDIQGGQE